MYYVYILKCSDSSLYTGITNNLDQRIEAHRSGKGARYVRSRLPIEILFSFTVADRSEALKWEAEIKRWPREQKLTFIQQHRH